MFSLWFWLYLFAVKFASSFDRASRNRWLNNAILLTLQAATSQFICLWYWEWNSVSVCRWPPSFRPMPWSIERTCVSISQAVRCVLWRMGGHTWEVCLKESLLWLLFFDSLTFWLFGCELFIFLFVINGIVINIVVDGVAQIDPSAEPQKTANLQQFRSWTCINQSSYVPCSIALWKLTMNRVFSQEHNWGKTLHGVNEHVNTDCNLVMVLAKPTQHSNPHNSQKYITKTLSYSCLIMAILPSAPMRMLYKK